MRIAVLVPDPEWPEPYRWTYDPEAAALTAAGATVEPLPWTQATDVSAFDLVTPLVAWGYHAEYPRWLELLDRAEAHRWPMINPPALLRWNGDKAYLAELADRGVSSVPTMAVESCCDADLEEARRQFDCDWLVVKPPVSASAAGTHRLGPNDDLPADSRGRPLIIQPLIEEIARTGEFSLMLFGGDYSHAVVKRPKSGDFRVQELHGGVTLPCRTPPNGAIELAQAALAAAPAAASYARVDIVPDDSGVLRIMELELIEPSLFLDPGRRRGFHPFADELRANNHCLSADVRFGGWSASSRATSISATKAFSGQSRSRAAASSARQKTGSRLIEV